MNIISLGNHLKVSILVQATLTIPSESYLNQLSLDKDYVRTYTIAVPQQVFIEEAAKMYLTATPDWLGEILQTKDQLADKVGMKNVPEKQLAMDTLAKDFSVGQKVDKYEVIFRSDKEIVLARDTGKLRFRNSLLFLPHQENQQEKFLVLTQLVQFKGFLGRILFKTIKPYQEELIPEMLELMAKALRKKYPPRDPGEETSQ